MAVSVTVNKDSTIGAILIGALISSFLFGILSIQVKYYFSTYGNDPRWMKVMVGLVWAIDFAHQLSATAMSYDHTIVKYPDPSSLPLVLWSFPTTILIEPFSSTIVQLFFVRRLYLLNSTLRPIALFTALACLTTFCAGEGTAIFTYLNPPGERAAFDYRALCFLWLCSAAACDLLITIPMILTLLNCRTGYRKTDRIVTKILLWIVNAGLLTASLAFAKIFVYMQKPDTMLCMAANIVLAKVYSVSLMAFLNRRGKLETLSEGNTWEDSEEIPPVADEDVKGKAPANKHIRTPSGILMTVSTQNHVDSADNEIAFSMPPDDYEESEREAIRIQPPRRPYMPWH